ncbi:MAG: hypothetical protein FJ010_00995 [Chloroflexi bacterium]|nr:hypothetical protein [Chloroflexota bacterium]
MFDIDTALECLNKFDSKDSYLGPTIEKLFAGLHTAIVKKDLRTAWDLVDRIQEVCYQYGVVTECAEADVKLSRIVLDLGDLERTEELLEGASGRYSSFRHQQGIAIWMLGCVLWQIPGRENDAIVTWRESIRIFQFILKCQFAAESAPGIRGNTAPVIFGNAAPP